MFKASGSSPFFAVLENIGCTGRKISEVDILILSSSQFKLLALGSTYQLDLIAIKELTNAVFHHNHKISFDDISGKRKHYDWSIGS